MRTRLLVLGFMLAGVLSATQARAAVITLESTETGEGMFDINISIADITDLYAFELLVTFDPAAAALRDVTEGTFLSGSGLTFSFLEPAADASSVRLVTTLLEPVPGATGSGLLATLLFEGAMSPIIGLTLVSFLDSSLQEIDDVRFVPPDTTSVPEPSTLGLLGIGLAVLARHRLRRNPQRSA